MKLTVAYQILLATYANLKFASAQESSIVDSYKDGCINHIDFTHNFEAEDDNGCDGCGLCEGSKLQDVFNPYVPRTCIECVTESKCSSFTVVTSFRNAWQMNFNMLHSSDMAAKYDPKQITISGSNDSKSWDDLYTTSSNSNIFQGRKEAKSFLFANNKTYKKYRITFNFTDLLKLYIGSYGIVEAYTRQCTSDLYNDTTENTLLPYATSAPTEVPTSASTNVALNNNNIKTAAELWLNDKIEAEATYGHISEWDTSFVTSMRGLFSTNSGNEFNEDLSKWNTSSVRAMHSMFLNCAKFNIDIGGWNVSAVTGMEYLFYRAWAFNQDISKWDVSSVSNMDSTIRRSGFNRDISEWDVSSVTYMSYMFHEAVAFNQDISKWDVSSVTYMAYMFEGPSEFNQDVSSWNISKVTLIHFMFKNNKAFKHQLCWDVKGVSDTDTMFAGSSGSIGCD